jgi:hypothetical protein
MSAAAMMPTENNVMKDILTILFLSNGNALDPRGELNLTVCEGD